jgi:rhamnogalacturonan endolyase
MTRKSFFLFLLLGTLALAASAEDPRERLYQTPPVQPAHQPKPKVSGWATARVEEKLGRGLLAMPSGEGRVYLSWRLLKTDAPAAAFNLYRQSGAAAPERLNAAPITATTDFTAPRPPAGQEAAYWVCPVAGGKELAPSGKVTLKPGSPAAPLYRSIKFQGNYTAQRIAAADLNGDGAYDFIIRGDYRHCYAFQIFVDLIRIFNFLAQLYCVLNDPDALKVYLVY